MVGMLVPEEILEHFELEEVLQEPDRYVLILREKKERLPASILRKKKAVLDGYMAPKELLTFPLGEKAVFLRLYRRRWKEKGGGERNFHNTYNFHEPGMLATKSFGAFLKEGIGK